MRTNDETESEFEDRIEGVQDEEPGNQNATTAKTFPIKESLQKDAHTVPCLCSWRKEASL